MDILTIKDIEAEWRVSRNLVMKALKMSNLEGLKDKNSGKWMFTREQVVAWRGEPTPQEETSRDTDIETLKTDGVSRKINDLQQKLIDMLEADKAKQDIALEKLHVKLDAKDSELSESRVDMRNLLDRVSELSALSVPKTPYDTRNTVDPDTPIAMPDEPQKPPEPKFGTKTNDEEMPLPDKIPTIQSAPAALMAFKPLVAKEPPLPVPSYADSVRDLKPEPEEVPDLVPAPEHETPKSDLRGPMLFVGGLALVAAAIAADYYFEIGLLDFIGFE